MSFIDILDKTLNEDLYHMKRTKKFLSNYKVSEMIHNKKYKELLKYKKYNWCDLINSISNIIDDDYPQNNMYEFFTNCESNILKHIIDNTIDLEYEDECNEWRPIHYICIYSIPEIIKYMIDKGVNLDCQMGEGWKPLDILQGRFKRNKLIDNKSEFFKIIEYIINKMCPK